MIKNDVNVYFIMGSSDCEEPLVILERALQAGITCFQLREKGITRLQGDAYHAFAQACQMLCQHYQVPFIVNDDVTLALALDAEGIHIGQEDYPFAYVRDVAPTKIIGVSVHTEQQMDEAVRLGADYVGIGPIYPTLSKADAQPPAGVAFLQRMRAKYPKYPIVAIGGIQPTNSASVRRAGADGVAVISALTTTSNMKKTIEQLNVLST